LDIPVLGLKPGPEPEPEPEPKPGPEPEPEPEPEHKPKHKLKVKLKPKPKKSTESVVRAYLISRSKINKTEKQSTKIVQMKNQIPTDATVPSVQDGLPTIEIEKN